MPARTSLHSLFGGLFRQWPGAERLALAGLDLACRVALAPFRRRRVVGQSRESGDLLAHTATYNQAAERYFANFPDPAFLLDKPFSETALAAKHLIDAGVLIDSLRLRRGDVVAEVGAGSCWLSHMLNRFGCRTVSIDVAPSALALGRQLFERDPRTNWELQPAFRTYDGHRLPLDDATCDAIVVNDAFHHIPNQRELLVEMYRVLKPEGIVAMSEPGRGHAAAEASVSEATAGVLENELVLEDLAALARSCGFAAVNVTVASPLVRREIPADDLGAFMGGKGFAVYWKAFCSGLEQHHYIVIYKGATPVTTRRPGRVLARIETAAGATSARAGTPLKLDVRVTNIGDTRWLAATGPGWTRIGAHLYRAGAARELVDFDWHRAGLPHDVGPGEHVMVPLTLPGIDTPGEYLVAVDLVIEGIMWFADAGSSPAYIDMSVAERISEPPG